MRTLLIDADIVAFKVAATSEESYDFSGTGNLATFVDKPKARANAERIVNEYCDTLNATGMIICLTDSVNDWKAALDPTYKANRSDAPRPQLLQFVKDHLAETYRSYFRERLEADDIMGILQTHPTLVPGEKVIVSEDKDLRTVPGLLWNPGRPELGVIDIDPLDADRFHMWQAICGDTADNVKGCPGVGKASIYADEIVFADRAELWDIVLDAYLSKGLGEEQAIHQARLVHILRASDYNFETKKIRLWSPLWLYHADHPADELDQ